MGHSNRKTQQPSGQPPLWEEEPRSLMGDIKSPPPFRMNTLLLTLCAAVCLALQGFLAITVPEPSAIFVSDANQPFLYSFQLPFAVFVGALLGPALGVTAILLFMLTSLFVFPLFANGGGTDYLFQPGFGYFIGMMAGAWLAGKMIQRAFDKEEHCGRSLYMFYTAFLSVLMTHLIGSVWVLALTAAGTLSWPEFPNMWMQLTGTPLLYDIVSAIAMFCLIRFTRLTFWLAIY